MKMKKILCSLLSASLIAASLAVPVSAVPEATTTTVPSESVKMTYVDQDNPDTAHGYIAAGSTATSGFNKVSSDGTISMDTPKWNVNFVTYLKIDASSITSATIAEATLTFEGSGSTDGKRTCSYGAVNIENTDWDNTLTYNIANDKGMLKGTVVGAEAGTSTKSATTFNSITLDITDALKHDEDRIITIAVYETAAAGGYIKNPSVTVKHVDVPEYTVTFDVAGNESQEVVYRDETVTSVPETERLGYIFNDWKKDEEETLYTTEQVAQMGITADTKFTAQYEDDPNYVEITISGESSLKADTSEQYTFTAKNRSGADVTASLTDAEWAVYDCDNKAVNGNTNITLNNGLLSVADGVLPQKIYLRVISAEKATYGSIEVEIKMSDSQKEAVIYSNACETALDGTERVDSVDGSKAYKATTATPLTFTDQKDYVLSSFDMKFGAENSGFIIKRSDGDVASSFIMRSGALSQETSGGKYTAIFGDIDTSKWYHVEVMYKAATDDLADNVSMNLYEYNEDGTYRKVYTGTRLNDRNGKNQGMIEVQADTIIDNVKVFTPSPNEIEASVANTLVYSGETTQCSAKVSWYGLPFAGADGVTWSIVDAEGLPMLEGPVSINQAGVLTVGATASDQIIKVKASSTSGAESLVTVEIKSSEIFNMKNIGIDEETGHITKLYAEKKLPYDDDVVFIMAFYKDGVLSGVRTLKGYGSNYPISEDVEIAVDWTIPEGFDGKTNPTDTAKVFIWTSLN